MATELVEKANEESSYIFEFDFKNGGVVVPVANIAAATMTLTLLGTSQVINNRMNVDVRSHFYSQGHFTFTLMPADNIVCSNAPGIEEESHLLTFNIVTTGAEPVTFKEEIILKVKNLQMVRSIWVIPAASSLVASTVAPTVIIV
jgi:hypothetical protein